MLQARYEMAAPDVIAESLDGEVLIVNLATGVYFRGDADVARVWTVVTSGSTPAVTDGTAQQVEAFIGELLAEGLIRERAAAASGASVSVEIPPGPFQLEKFEDLQDMLALDPIHDVDPNAGWPQPQ